MASLFYTYKILLQRSIFNNNEPNLDDVTMNTRQKIFTILIISAVLAGSYYYELIRSEEITTEILVDLKKQNAEDFERQKKDAYLTLLNANMEEIEVLLQTKQQLVFLQNTDQLPASSPTTKQINQLIEETKHLHDNIKEELSDSPTPFLLYTQKTQAAELRFQQYSKQLQQLSKGKVTPK